MLLNDTLKVDAWDTSYDAKNNLIETYAGKKPMKVTSEQKYLGFILSQDNNNMANIKYQENKSFAIIRSIMNMVSGLKTNTI